MSFSSRALAALAGLAFSSLAGTALAQEPGQPTGIERPAPTVTDPQTGAQSVVVPRGCTATKRSNGQLAILCPFAAPGTEAAEASKPRTESKWYGWEILLVDGAVLSTTLLLASTDNDTLQGMGAMTFLTGYTLGGPVVHWANGQVGKGFASLGIRVGAPLVTGLLGGTIGLMDASSCSDYTWCGTTSIAVGAAIGASLGAIAAIAVDSAVLGRKTISVPTRESRARAPKLQWTPTAGYDAKRQSATVGITGTF